MPFNGSGVFSPISPPDYPAVAGSVIRAAQFNAVMSDIFGGLSACATRDGQAPMTGAQNMGGFKHTNVAAATARTDYARAAEVQDGKMNYLTSVGGTANAITATALLSMTAYAAGQVFYLTVQADNTAAATLNINGIGAVNIKRPAGAALQAGDLKAGTVIPIIFDGTQFQIITVPTTGADLTNYALKDGSNSTGTWGISISGNAATASTATTANAIADGAVSAAAKIAANIITLNKLARTGTAGQILYSGGAASDPSWGAPPSFSGVSTFNTRSGAVTLTSADVTTALGYTPANGSFANYVAKDMGGSSPLGCISYAVCGAGSSCSAGATIGGGFIGLGGNTFSGTWRNIHTMTATENAPSMFQRVA